MKTSLLLVLILSLLTFGACLAQNKLPSSQGTIAVGGEGGWDYLLVDTSAHRLYVSHGTHVPVVDLGQSKVVADIQGTPGVHGIAVAPELGKGFISDGRDSSVTVFDLKSDSTLAKVIVTGANPDAILYEPFTQQVFTFNGRSSNSTVIDAKSLKVVGTIPLEGKPEFAVSDYRESVYVNIEDKSLITRIDAKTLKVMASWPLAPCEEPSGLAIDRANRRLFSVGGNKMMAVMDADNGKVVATIPIGERVDGCAFDPATHLAFSSNGEGTLTVIRQDSPDKYSVVGKVDTSPGARTIALDESTHRIYLSVGSRPSGNDGKREDFRVLVYQE